MTKHVNHICIHKDCIIFGDQVIPFGKDDIEKDFTFIISDVLDYVVPLVKEGDIIVCGEGESKRMLGRKLEDRLGREVIYK